MYVGNLPGTIVDAKKSCMTQPGFVKLFKRAHPCFCDNLPRHRRGSERSQDRYGISACSFQFTLRRGINIQKTGCCRMLLSKQMTTSTTVKLSTTYENKGFKSTILTISLGGLLVLLGAIPAVAHRSVVL